MLHYDDCTMGTTTQDVHMGVSAAEQAKQADFSRNLKKAQIDQRNIQKTINSGQVNNQNTTQYGDEKTDAQKKQGLRGRQRWHARMIQARKRDKRKAMITKKYDKIIRQYGRVSWMLLYVAAASDAFFDLLTIPVLSTILSFCTSLYINAVLWNVGGKKGRAKRRIIRASISTLDLIPIINLIPFSVIIVYRTQEDEKNRVERAKKALKKLSKI